MAFHLLFLLFALLQGPSLPGPGPVITSALPSTLYYGTGCNGTASNSGCTIESTTQSSIQAYMIGDKYTMGSNVAGYSASAIGVYFTAKDGTNPDFQVAIFADSGGNPGSKVCSSSADVAIGTVSTWTEAPLTGCGTLAASTAYWVVFQQKGSGNTVVENGVNSVNGRFVANTYGSWPATWSGGSNAAQYSLYIKVSPN